MQCRAHRWKVVQRRPVPTIPAAAPVSSYCCAAANWLKICSKLHIEYSRLLVEFDQPEERGKSAPGHIIFLQHRYLHTDLRNLTLLQLEGAEVLAENPIKVVNCLLQQQPRVDVLRYHDVTVVEE